MPEFLAGLCNHCMVVIAFKGWGDGEERDRPVLERDLEDHLCQQLQIAAHRVAEGKSVRRCDVLKAGMFTADADYQCEGWASRELDGHQVCPTCESKYRRWGHMPYFVDGPIVRPQLFAIWASTPEEMLQHAMDIVRKKGTGPATP